DGQVSGIQFNWVNGHAPGAEVRVQGVDLFDLAKAEEFSTRSHGTSFTFLVPKTAPENMKQELRAHYKERVDIYFEMTKRGIPERDAGGILPIVNHKYVRRGHPVARDTND